MEEIETVVFCGRLCLFGSRRWALGLAIVVAALVFAPPLSSSTLAGRPHRAVETQALNGFRARRAMLRCGGDHGREVALSFDDGPSALTSRLLALLASHHAAATFFLIGRNIAAYRHAVAAEAAAGDEIGNHTWNHLDLTTLSPSEVDRELTTTSQAIRAVTGTLPRLMRPPGGMRDAAVDAETRADGLIETLWSVDPRDWASDDPDGIARTVLSQAAPGAIILLHDGRPATLAALPMILDGLQARGLRSVTIPRLLADDPPTSSMCAPPLD